MPVTLKPGRDVLDPMNRLVTIVRVMPSDGRPGQLVEVRGRDGRVARYPASALSPLDAAPPGWDPALGGARGQRLAAKLLKPPRGLGGLDDADVSEAFDYIMNDAKLYAMLGMVLKLRVIGPELNQLLAAARADYRRQFRGEEPPRWVAYPPSVAPGALLQFARGQQDRLGGLAALGGLGAPADEVRPGVIVIARTAAEGGSAPFIVTYVRVGGRYGLDAALVAKEPMIEFYDARYPHDADIGGQFVARYHLDTMRKWAQKGTGLALHDGTPAWTLGVRGAAVVRDALARLGGLSKLSREETDMGRKLRAGYAREEAEYAAQKVGLPHPYYTGPEHILEGVARALWVDAWASETEERHPEQTSSWAGRDLTDLAPKTPKQANALAKKFLGEVEKANGGHVGNLVLEAWDADAMNSGRRQGGGEPLDLRDWTEYQRLFGHYLAMQGLGHGVGWFDDHARFPLKVPSVENYDLRDEVK